MPSSKEHREKAKENRSFLDALRGGTAPKQWVATVAFYTELHLVERLAASEQKPKHHAQHGERLHFLLAHKTHKAIAPFYENLYNASLVARYGTVNLFDSTFLGDDVWDQLVDIHLRAIEEHVKKFFGAGSAY